MYWVSDSGGVNVDIHPFTVITSYSIHYTKLYDAATLNYLSARHDLFVAAAAREAQVSVAGRAGPDAEYEPLQLLRIRHWRVGIERGARRQRRAGDCDPGHDGLALPDRKDVSYNFV